ncbi:hypothetical protein [Sulfuritortus calidifontis]|nr:hypothetical protein [Sulfuritortus calidifontis]
MAEETEGTTWTNTSWRFLHFGPFASALADEIDLLAKHSKIQEFTGGGGTGKDYTLYTVGEWSTAKTFEGLGLPRDVRLKLSKVIRDFANDLSSLLDMVYFQTEPMQGVRPGQELSFESARKVDFKTDIKPIKIPISNTSRAARIQALAKKIGENYLKTKHGLPATFVAPIRDQYFAETFIGNEDDRIEGHYSAELTFGEG